MKNALDAGEPDADDKKTPAKKGAKLGSGSRFAALKAKLANEKGVRNPAALAASIGQKKYGAPAMSAMAAKNR